jgi:hypothetical protein
LFSQSGDALAGPEGFAQLRHVKFIIRVVSDQGFSVFATSESKQEALTGVVGLDAVAYRDSITAKSSAFL